MATAYFYFLDRQGARVVYSFSVDTSELDSYILSLNGSQVECAVYDKTGSLIMTEFITYDEEYEDNIRNFTNEEGYTRAFNTPYGVTVQNEDYEYMFTPNLITVPTAMLKINNEELTLEVPITKLKFTEGENNMIKYEITHNGGIETGSYTSNPPSNKHLIGYSTTKGSSTVEYDLDTVNSVNFTSDVTLYEVYGDNDKVSVTLNNEGTLVDKAVALYVPITKISLSETNGNQVNVTLTYGEDDQTVTFGGVVTKDNNTLLGFTYNGTTYRIGQSYDVNWTSDVTLESSYAENNYVSVELFKRNSSGTYVEGATESKVYTPCKKITVTLSGSTLHYTIEAGGETSSTATITGSYEIESYTNHHLAGFSTSQGGAIFVALGETKTFSVQTENIELYEVWEEDPKITVTIKNNTGTSTLATVSGYSPITKITFTQSGSAVSVAIEDGE